MKTLVSIIVPCYNSEKYIHKAIESVLNQSFKNWEMLIIDDCSTDNSVEIILNYSKLYNNISYFKTEVNSGSAAIARNIGIKNANGKYIAFLDSDDSWLPTKLEQQLVVFDRNPDAAIVYCNYEKISDDEIRSNRIVYAPKKVNYEKLLYSNVICCSSAIYNSFLVGKTFFRQIGHEDFVTWLDILKKGYNAYNVDEVLVLYRVSKNSLSSNKFRVLKWQWNIYRNIEGFGILKSSKYFLSYAYHAFLKFII